MKKILLSLGVAVVFSGAVKAQEHNHADHAAPVAATAQQTTPQPAATQVATTMTFKADAHDFGTVAEGPAAEYEFAFKNTGKEPIIIERVQASCGCTTPSYSKEPIAPGQTGNIKASFNTQGRPGNFNKTLTVFSNVGTKILTIQGNVEKAPTSSVPENGSMMKTF